MKNEKFVLQQFIKELEQDFEKETEIKEIENQGFFFSAFPFGEQEFLATFEETQDRENNKQINIYISTKRAEIWNKAYYPETTLEQVIKDITKEINKD